MSTILEALKRLQKDNSSINEEATNRLVLCSVSSDMIEELLKDIKESGNKIDSIWCNSKEGFVFIRATKPLPKDWDYNDDGGFLTFECGLDEDEIFLDNGDINKEYIINEYAPKLVEWDGTIYNADGSRTKINVEEFESLREDKADQLTDEEVLKYIKAHLRDYDKAFGSDSTLIGFWVEHTPELEAWIKNVVETNTGKPFEKTFLDDLATESKNLNEDLIVVEPEDAKEKLTALKFEIEEAEGDVKEFLMELMDIYLFQTHKPSDRENSSLTDEEWQEFADWMNDLRGDDKIEEAVVTEKISRDLAHALHLSRSWTSSVDWEKSEIKQITKAEARKEYENGNKENLIVAERDGDGDLRIMAANGNRWGFRGSGSFRDALRDGTEFYLISKRVEHVPNHDKYREIVPGGDTGSHYTKAPWDNDRDPNKEKDIKAGRYAAGHELWNGEISVDSKNRYAASLADLQKNILKYKELKRRLNWAKESSNFILSHRDSYKSDDKLAQEKEKKVQKIKDQIAMLQQDLANLESAPLDTVDNQLKKYDDQIDDLTSQIGNLLRRPQATEDLEEGEE